MPPCLLALLLATVACAGSGSTGRDDASGPSSDQRGEQSGRDGTSMVEAKEYCDRLHKVADTVATHTNEFLNLDEQATNGEPLRKATLAVARGAGQAREHAPGQIQEDWAAFQELYQTLADALEGSGRPFDAILELEEGEVEWSSAVYGAGANIDSDAQTRCGFDPNLRADPS